MRRVIFLILGLLELAIGIVLFAFGCQLPSREEVNRGFHGAERVTDHAGTQVRILRRQVQELRQPKLQQLANDMRTQTHVVTRTLKSQQVDFDTVRTMRDALGEVADGLDSMARTLDATHVAKLGDGLGETAEFLDQKVVPGALKTADRIDESTAALRTDAKRLDALLKQAPLDLKAAREIHDSLGRFGEGLDKMNALLKLQRLDTMREGFKGLEEALTSGADQVERLSSYTYPVVTFNGFKPEIEQKQFWPDGENIAKGMRKAAQGAIAAGKELDGLNKDLPQLRTSLDESRKVVAKTREALGVALEQQDKIEPLLKDAPAHAAKLAEDLPKIGQDLSRILRDTEKLKDVATALRQARKSLDATASRWPEVQKALLRSASLLRGTRNQLERAVEHRHEYEAAMKQTMVLAETFTQMLPMLTDQLDNRLDEEEQALNELGQSLEEVQTILPVYAKTTNQLFQAGRLLSWLVACIIGLHGAYLMLSVRLGPRYSL
ncbi:MAG: hypothetical protein K2R98_10125 [Gemmataceae bacterium]|nr:hypothetical protein [Gemmataceae bacterium]